jgi:hypothetical protein
LISTEQHEKARENGVREVELFKPNPQKAIRQYGVSFSEDTSQLISLNSCSTPVPSFGKFFSEGSVSVYDAFLSTINHFDLAGVTIPMFEEVKRLFFHTIVYPHYKVLESDLYHLLAPSVVFIKSRDPDQPMNIVPVVSLQFLYFFRDPTSYGCRCSCPLSAVSKPLVQHTDALLSMIGRQLCRPSTQLPYVFESALPIVELVSVAAWLSTSKIDKSTSLEDFYSGVLFRPWGNESLRVAPFMLEETITLFSTYSVDEYTSSTNSSSNNNSSSSSSHGLSCELLSLCDAVTLALNPMCDTVYFHQALPNDGICAFHHISRLFALAGQEEQAVPCFCSIQFRPDSDAVTLAYSVHRFIKEKLQPNCPTLQTNGYYVVVYCCGECETCHVLNDFPLGTAVVPLEAIQSLLKPFGLQQLVTIAEEAAISDKF